MQTFHLTWMAFFLCFFGWFGLAPALYPGGPTPLERQLADVGPIWAGIAARHGTTVNALARANNLDDTRLIYPGQRLSQRLPIGTTEVIRTAPRQRLLDYYRAWYRPERATMVVVGDVDRQPTAENGVVVDGDNVSPELADAAAAEVNAAEQGDAATASLHAPGGESAPDPR